MSIGEKLLDALNELNALGLLEEFKAENRELVDSFMNKLYVAELATLRQKLAEAEKERDKVMLMMVRSTSTKRSLRYIALENLRHIRTLEMGEAEREAHLEDGVRKLATAVADCAAMREALGFYADQKFFAVMPDDGKTRVVPICNEDGSFAHYLAFVNDDGEVARAALTRPTGQAILDELSAARELIEAQSEDRAAYNPEPWKEEQHLRMQKAEERLSKAEERYDAARKANGQT